MYYTGNKTYAQLEEAKGSLARQLWARVTKAPSEAKVEYDNHNRRVSLSAVAQVRKENK